MGLGPGRDEASISDEWQGSPYVRWRVPFLKEGSVDHLARAHHGVLVWLRNHGRVTKLAYVTEEGGMTQWIIPYLPRKSGLLGSSSFEVTDARFLLLGQGDVLRAIDITTGEDAWNRGGCTSVTSTGKNVWATCLGSVVLLDPNTGRILQELSGMQGGVLARAGNRVLFLENETIYPLTRETRTYLRTGSPRALVGGRVLTVWSDTPPTVEVILPTGALAMTRELPEFPSRPWHAVVDGSVVVPVSSECIAAYDLHSGAKKWDSCALHTAEPAVVVSDGLFLLSSSQEDGERPIVFVDGTNGLQTMLFNPERDEVAGRPEITAVHLAGGPNPSNTIFAVDSSDNLMAIRVAR